MRDSHTREAYLQSWGTLSERLRGESVPSGLTPSDRKRELLKYETMIRRAVTPILKNVGDRLSHTGPCRLGRGIVYINSIFTNARIRLPLLGIQEHGVTWRKWCGQVRAGNPEEFMFLQPDKPSHLLTELMWRLQKQDCWGKGFALGLFMTSQNTIYSRLKGFGNLWLFLAASDAEWPPPGFDQPKDKTAKQFADLPDLLGHADENSLYKFESLGGRLEEHRYDVRDDCELKHGPMYTTKDVEILTRRGLNVLFDCWKDDKPADSIFYLPDVVETEFLGGVDFGIVFDGNQVTKDQLSEFLKDVQWMVHECIIDLVVSAERKTASVGDTYRSAYFVTNKPIPAADDDKVGIQKALETVRDSVSDSPAREVLNSLLSHFTLAFTDRGMYWRGYASQAHAVACRVAQILELLFPADERIVKPGLAKAVRRAGRSVENIKRHLKHQPFFIQQLFEGLRAENDLFYLPLYREHFIHSFHCFVIGVLLLGVRPKRVINDTSFPFLKDAQFLRAWFLTSMWHDIAYPLQKAGDLVEVGVRRLIGEDHTKRHVGLLPIQPSVGHLFQVEGLIKSLTGNGIPWNDVLSLPESIQDTIDVKDAVVAVALDHLDHGVWSAFMFKHALDSEKVGRRVRSMLGSTLMGKVFAGIIPHHASEWKWGELAKGFWKRENGVYKTIEYSPPEFPHIAHNLNPLGYLLSLSDIVSQAGREAPEFDTSVPSNMGIRFQDIRCTEDTSLLVALNYDNPKKALDIIIDKHFQKPAACLGMWNGTVSENRDKERFQALKESLVIEFRKKDENKNEEPLWLSLNLDGD